MSLPSYTLDDPADIIQNEIAWLQGAFIGSLLCGVQITLSAMSFLAVFKQDLSRTRRIVLLTYILLLCAIMTAGQQASLLFIQMAFTEGRGSTGGSSAFLTRRFATPVDVASTCLFVVGNWMMESLMVWRCKVVCSSGRRPIWVGILLPCILLVSEYVISALFLHKVLRGGDTTHYVLAYMTLSLALNVIVTAIIAGRLLRHRRWTTRQFGPGHGSHYASVAAVLIESASLYTGFLVLTLVFFTVDSPTYNVLQQTVAQIEGIASLLVIYRIARGKGWDDDDDAVVSSIDWRGSTMGQELHEMGRASDPASDRTAGHVAVALSVLSTKGDATPMSPSSVDGTAERYEAV